MAALTAASGQVLRAQAIPVASASPISTGFQLPTAAGTLQYSLSGFESLTSGYYSGSGWDSATGVNGNLAMITSSKQYPFSMVVSAGRFFSTSGQPSSTYADLAFSQVINLKSWTFVLSDTVGYLPGTPSAGLSGVPGTGDAGIPPVQVGIYTNQGVLTGYGTQLTNAAALNIQRHITGRISAQASAAYTTLRFVGSSAGTGLNSDTYLGSGGLSYVLSGRTTLLTNFMYSTYSYGSNLPGFTSKTVTGGFTHQFSRRLSMDFSAGPQWTTTQSVSGIYGYPVNTPNNSITSLSAYVNTDLNYTGHFTSYSAGYSRGTNSGYGLANGSSSDSVRATASRTFSRVWNASGNAAYAHTTTLPGQALQFYAPDTVVATGQVSRSLTRSLSTYASYTLEKQSGATSGSVFNVFSGSFQVVGFGLTYSPSAIHFGNH